MTLEAGGRADLHAHTTASDGVLAPAELVGRAAASGLAALALTDHDTTDGVAEALAAGETLAVRIVPGVELNCSTPEGHADLLGYFVDAADEAFGLLMARFRADRRVRAEGMVERLQALGAQISFADVVAEAHDGAFGRPHVARALVKSGFVPDVASAFELHIGPGGPAYVERYRLTLAEGCAAVRAARGVPVLAHPAPPGGGAADDGRLRALLGELADAGLGGLECHYPGYGERTTRWLVSLARHFDLVATGGSDFHAPGAEDHELGAVTVPLETVDRLEARSGK